MAYSTHMRARETFELCALHGQFSILKLAYGYVSLLSYRKAVLRVNGTSRRRHTIDYDRQRNVRRLVVTI